MILDTFDLEKQCEEIKGLKKSDVEHILEWVRLQPHLPPINEMIATFFLHSSGFSCEKVKKYLDNYYTFRTHMPDFFRHLDPRSERLVLAQKTIITGVLPKLTPENYIISMAKLADTNPANYDFQATITLYDMTAAVYGHTLGYIHGQVVLVDLAGGTLQHLAKMNNLVQIRKLLKYIQDAIPVKLKAIHIVNPVVFLDTAMNILKSIADKELINAIQVHTTYDSLYKVVPKDCLPVELGGTACTTKEIQEKTTRLLLENIEFFKLQETKIVDESKRLGKAKNPDEIFGLDGTFKKLDID